MTVRVRLSPVLMKETLACFAKGRSIIEIGCPENALGLESSEDCAFVDSTTVCAPTQIGRSFNRPGVKPEAAGRPNHRVPVSRR